MLVKYLEVKVTHDLASKITMTALMFTLLFIAAIKCHGDNEPPITVKYVEALGLLFSGSISFVFMLVSIWTK